MFQPFKTILTDDEVDLIYSALKKGLWAVKKVGSIDEIQQMRTAFDLLGNHARIGGWETEAERKAASIRAFAEECQTYGCD